MGDEFRRELGRAFEQMSGAPSPALGERVRSSLAGAPERRGPYWIAGVAAVAIAALVITVLFVGHPLNRAPVNAGPGVRTSPSASATPSAAPSFDCSSQPVASSPPVAQPVSFIDAVQPSTQPGFDRLTIEFSNGRPGAIVVGGHSGTSFTLSPSGQPVTLQGVNGILVTIDGADLHTAYSGPTDILTGFKGLVEVRRVQDFEGTVQIALGINGSPSCFHITLNPNSLVIDVPAS